MVDYRGTCHCGTVAFRFEAPEISAGMRCNCSICRRRGALLSLFTLAPDALDIAVAGGGLGRYKFGSRIATHCFCRICGVFTFVETRLNPGEYRVNLGCIDRLDIRALAVEPYDAAEL